MTNQKIHPFEAAGMGQGPYRFLYMWSFPSKDLAERNPEAYRLALREMPRDLSGGCGTCRHCGMAISNVCVVQDAEGVKYGVGSDCVEKTGDPSLGDKAKIAVANLRNKRARERAAAKREERHQAWLATVCNDRGETNAERLARENSEKDAAAAAQAAKRVAKAAILRPVAELVRDGKGGFCDSVASDMEAGHVPYGRGRSITLDIYGSRHGRRNSAAYDEAFQKAAEAFDAAEAIDK